MKTAVLLWMVVNVIWYVAALFTAGKWSTSWIVVFNVSVVVPILAAVAAQLSGHPLFQ